ncbi:MAG: NUDIX hydrolase [Propioniciclava sp.]|uniref:NUDIX domain-containing protein n=1 Tax=Propioniciclava sp. TaxID=2038686 RepID=UPI0039E58833
MDRQPTYVSVDVLALRYNPELRRVELATAVRRHEPYRGQLALPGVTLLEGERLDAAAARTVASKLGFGVRAQGQLAVFDEPHRDPRGYTLSVVMWAVIEDDAAAEAELAADEEREGAGQSVVRWHTFGDVPALVFDHNTMINVCWPLLADKLWRDLAFTRALTGETFPVSAAVALTQSLTGASPDRGNLNRRLASVRGLGVTDQRVAVGRGRPGTMWAWQDADMPAASA